MLLDNLLNWALSQTGGFPYKPKNLNLADQVETAMEVHQSSGSMKNIKLLNRLHPDLTLFADESALSTVLRNLLANAIKFSHPNSTVTISAKSNDEFAEITISDTGTGMTEKQVSTLFSLDKKSTTGTSGEKGTGLGLILCKELVELNKGTLRIESIEGEGTHCHFTIPVVA
jgi:signal transduction histidine kinase